MILMMVIFYHWGQGRRWYLTRSHDFQPTETDFSDGYDLVQQDLEIREESLTVRKKVTLKKLENS